MLLNDKQIQALATGQGMISPYIPILVSSKGCNKVISYGQSSFGYDIRLSEDTFFTFSNRHSLIVDPKSFKKKELLDKQFVRVDDRGTYFVIPGNSYALGVSEEYFQIPNDVLGVCVGKSTYARVSLIVNVTPLEPGWKGFLTLEFSNASPSPIKVYANEGICQILFFKGDTPNSVYNRKYQGQEKEVTYAKV